MEAKDQIALIALVVSATALLVVFFKGFLNCLVRFYRNTISNDLDKEYMRLETAGTVHRVQGMSQEQLKQYAEQVEARNEAGTPADNARLEMRTFWLFFLSKTADYLSPCLRFLNMTQVSPGFWTTNYQWTNRICWYLVLDQRIDIARYWGKATKEVRDSVDEALSRYRRPGHYDDLAKLYRLLRTQHPYQCEQGLVEYNADEVFRNVWSQMNAGAPARVEVAK